MEPPAEYSYQQKILIHKPVNRLFAIWHKIIYLPQIFDVFEDVVYITSNQYRCTSRIRDAKELVIWDIIVTEHPVTDITWHSANTEDFMHKGHVHFNKNGDRNSEVSVSLYFLFPFLEGNRNRSDILGSDFEQRLSGDLRRFKGAVEADEFPRDTKGREGLTVNFTE